MSSKSAGRDFIFVSNRDVIEKVSFDDILFFESQGRKVLVHTKDRLITFYGSIRKTQEKLDERFHSCHGSFVVNMTKIVRFQDWEIVLENETRIPVSQRRKGETIRRYLAYFDQHFPCNPGGNIV